MRAVPLNPIPQRLSLKSRGLRCCTGPRGDETISLDRSAGPGQAADARGRPAASSPKSAASWSVRPVSLVHLLIVALVQGVTEFLPISSSAHLILIPALTDWPDQGLIIDVAVHVGTLLAVLIYFARDVWTMVKGALLLAVGRWTPGGKLALQVVLASVPVIVAGLLLHALVLGEGRDLRLLVQVIAWATLGFGILLWIADRVSMQVRKIEHLGWGDALLIGLAQALALIPGTSRSGITMTAGRFLGMERSEAARFSMLLSIPTILAAGTVAGVDLHHGGDARLTLGALVAGGLAFLTALCAIAVLMRWLRRAGFAPFVVYRILLGLGLLGLLHFTPLIPGS